MFPRIASKRRPKWFIQPCEEVFRSTCSGVGYFAGMKRFLIVLLLFISCSVSAQQVTGHWYGVGKVAMPGEFSSYLGEIKLKQKGTAVTGQLQYYFRDSLFTVNLNGTFNSNTRRLNFKPAAFIYYLSRDTRNSIDCMLEGRFTLVVSRNESVLNGAFESDEAHKYTSPSIQFRFRYSTDTTEVIREVLEEEEEEMNEVVAVDTVTAVAPVVQRDSLPTLPDNREKVYVKDIEVRSTQLRLEVYDNGSIDYDSVSLYLNNIQILPKSKLDHKAIRRTIQLDSTLAFNELSMFAENLGMIPPNTAALILYDGNTRHELILTSDLNNTATIRIRRKKE